VFFSWKKSAAKPRTHRDWAEVLRKLSFFPEHKGEQLIRFDHVTLPPSISDLNIQIPAASWVLLYGDDDFAKALFCDLCFHYIRPEGGSVAPHLKGSDVSFLGRSNTTYGRTLVDHLGCGVRENTRELMEFTAKHVLSRRFKRHLHPGSLEFQGGREAKDMELDERDFLEIAEANVLLQKRRAAVIDTTSDFYQIALEQGFRHSEAFLHSEKILIWIIDDKNPPPADACPWAMREYKSVKKLSLNFPTGSRAGYIN
jgi:hypothetical protein